MKKLRQSSRIALGGMVTALSVVLMLLSIIPAMTYVAPAVAGVLLIIIVIEIDKKWAFFVYLAVSLLAMLISPDRAAAIMYVMLFGYYPIIKSLLENRKPPRVLEWLVKILLFNVAIVLSYVVTVYLFGIPMDEMGGGGVWMLVFSLAAGNVAFLLYDFVLTRLISLYLHSWRKIFQRIFK